MTFWDHLDVLRTMLIRCSICIVTFAIVAFCCRNILFEVVLAPQADDFFIYDFFRLFSPLPAFHVDLVNTGLARQFIIHVQISLAAGVIAASPYLLFELFRFILPALYEAERRYFLPLLVGGYAMFALGAALSYCLLFPLTFRFLGTYQVSSLVPNLITLDSYISTLLSMTLTMGLVFQLPVIIWLLGQMGLITATLLRTWRRHAVVAVLIASAIITPTGDAFTLLIVALPIYLLYEFSICLAPKAKAKD